MSFYQRNTYSRGPLEEFKQLFRSKNMLIKLIIINVAVWLAVRIIVVLFDLFNANITEDILKWLAVPADPVRFLTRPWTLLSYMFLHYDFWHILFNMLWLYWFGRIFLEYMSEKQLLGVYLLGGLAGAALYIISFNIFPKFQGVYLRSIALGASASVMAIVIAISAYVPQYRIHLLFFGPVKIVYIAVASVILDILMIRSGNSGGHLAHLGGAFLGYYYIQNLRKGNDLSNFLRRLPKFNVSVFKRRQRRTKFRNIYTNVRPVSDEDYNANKMEHQKKIDSILDKISKSGYESLTKEEKELLFKSSRKNN
ncbi:MAG: rhomboid family intramembrane serine protease [Bacteroidales bacterium]